MGMDMSRQEREMYAYRVTLEGVDLPSAYRDGVKNTTVQFAMDRWPRPTEAIQHVFNGPGEFDKIDQRRCAQVHNGGPIKTCVAYLTYENPIARSGGMMAVARELAGFLSGKSTEVLRISPYHQHLAKPELKRDEEDKNLVRINKSPVKVRFDGAEYNVDVMEYSHKSGKWYLIKSADFFKADGGDGGTDPYMYSQQPLVDDRNGPNSLLLRDALFACAAVPEVLRALGKHSNLVVHAQDWHFASSVLTVKQALLDGTLESAAVVLTSHNPFDHCLPKEALKMITSRWDDKHWQPIGQQERLTVYSRMLPLMDGPISTVSQVFASELTTDSLQTSHFAPHLQRIFEYIGIVGIENGLFINAENPYTKSAIDKARAGDFTSIVGEKEKNRHVMLAALEAYVSSHPDEVLGRLDGGNSRPLKNLDERTPIFLMSSRMDPGQKGSDVLARAIDAFPKGYARFIMVQMVGNDNDPAIQPFLQDLENLAARRAGDVVIFKRNVGDLYRQLLAGCTWSVWPSLYEPFGSVSESYVFGTPSIVRATGGLAQQVIDVGDDLERCTGMAYREAVSGVRDIGQAWSRIQTATAPADRGGVVLYSNMITSLSRSIQDGANIFNLSPQIFGRLLLNVYDKAQELSWSRAAQHYLELYGLARRP